MRFELTRDFLNELEEAIVKNDIKWIEESIFNLHVADIASVIDELDNQSANFIYKLLDEERQADVLIELDEDIREDLLKTFSTKERARQLENLDSDDAPDVIAELPKDKVEEVISQITDDEAAEDIVDLLNYDEDSAGGLMQKEFIKA